MPPPRISPTPQAAAEDCARHILVLLEDALAAGASPALAISGGSSPKPMFEYFARADFAWEKVHIFWVDERSVPPTDPQSNYKLANDTWLKPAAVPLANVHRVPTELPPDQAAQRYVEDIQSHFQLRPGELPRFEVIHRGMGADAHTASLFPGDPKINDHTNIAAPVYAEPMKQWRVTLLPGVLENARHTVMLVSGPDKREPLNTVLHAPYDPMHYPAQLARDSATWFLDPAAAPIP